jgi:pyruvate/2-oxoglutarate dehydrogenase complex dihydrolipoamide dehydrogenase (E3) component
MDAKVIDFAPLSEVPDGILNGRGFVAGPTTVAVLDARTGDESQLLQTAVVVIAAGQEDGCPRTSFLGLSKLGVELDGSDRIIVSEQGRSSCPTVFAVGTCCSRPDLLLEQVAAAIGDTVGCRQHAELAR